MSAEHQRSISGASAAQGGDSPFWKPNLLARSINTSSISSLESGIFASTVQAGCESISLVLDRMIRNVHMVHADDGHPCFPL